MLRALALSSTFGLTVVGGCHAEVGRPSPTVSLASFIRASRSRTSDSGRQRRRWSLSAGATLSIAPGRPRRDATFSRFTPEAGASRRLVAVRDARASSHGNRERPEAGAPRSPVCRIPVLCTWERRARLLALSRLRGNTP